MSYYFNMTEGYFDELWQYLLDWIQYYGFLEKNIPKIRINHKIIFMTKNN